MTSNSHTETLQEVAKKEGYGEILFDSNLGRIRSKTIDPAVPFVVHMGVIKRFAAADFFREFTEVERQVEQLDYEHPDMPALMWDYDIITAEMHRSAAQREGLSVYYNPLERGIR